MNKNNYWIIVEIVLSNNNKILNGFGYWIDATQWIASLAERDLQIVKVKMTLRGT